MKTFKENSNAIEANVFLSSVHARVSAYAGVNRPLDPAIPRKSRSSFILITVHVFFCSVSLLLGILDPTTN